MPIDLSLTPENLLVRESVRDFVAREILPDIRDWDRGHVVRREVFDRMAELGYLGAPVWERWGGAGMDYTSLGILCEELERADTAFRVIMSVHVALNSLTLMQWATEEQRQRWLVPQARGEKLATFGLTEPGAGTDVAAIATTATRDGDVVCAQRLQALDQPRRHRRPLPGVRDGRPVARSQGHHGVRAGARACPACRPAPSRGKMGIHAGNTGSITLDRVRVPAEHRIGEEGEGFAIAMSAIDQGRYTVATGAVGLAQACLDASVRYAHERRTFGEEIGRHQLVKQMLAKMGQGIEAGRLLCRQVAWLKDRGERNTRETSLAKWFCTDHAVQSALDAIQVHGAYGYSDEFPVERYLRNSKAAVIYEGTSQLHTLIQADYLLGYREDRPMRMPALPSQGHAAG